MVMYIAMAVGGFVAIWVLQGILDWLIFSRALDDPVKGKILGTIVAYFLAAILVWMSQGTPMGFLAYLPGAALVGWLEMGGAKKVQARIDAQDDASAFE